MPHIVFLLLFAGTSGLFGPLPLHAAAASPLTIEQAWARPAIGNSGRSAAYFTVRNTGTLDDRLIGVETDIAQRPELHTHLVEDGIMRMRRLEGADIPAGGVLRFRPGGHHIMLLDLKKKLSVGERFSMRLVFQNAGPVSVSFSVQRPESR